MVWIHDVVERDSVFMNPMRPEKFLRLARELNLGPDDSILEIGAGRCGPSLLLAQEFGCSVTAVEPHQPFLDDGRGRAAAAGLSDRFEFVHGDGKSFVIEPDRYAAVFCLGATFAYEGLGGTLDALAPAVRPGGHVVCGEPYRHHESDVIDYEMHPWTLGEVCERFEERDLAVMWLVRSSVDEWDEYTSIHTRDLLNHLEAHPDEAEEVRPWRRSQVEGFGQPYIGWAVVAGRKSTCALR